MKVLHSFAAGVVLALASLTSAQAHDAFNIGISLGGYGPQIYAPAAYYAPPVVYRAAPEVYYPAPQAYYRAPVVVYRDVYYRGYGGPRRYFSERGYYGEGHHHGHHH